MDFWRLIYKVKEGSPKKNKRFYKKERDLKEY